MGRIYGYARVSSRDQNLDRQIKRLEEAYEEYNNKHPKQERRPYKIYTDKKTGRNFDRPGWLNLRDHLRAGDTVVITSLDRLGRNSAEVRGVWHDLEHMGVYIRVLDKPMLDTDPETCQIPGIQHLVFELLNYLAEQEWLSIHQRQLEGIASAKAAGRSLGRPREPYPIGFERLAKRYTEGAITAKEAYVALQIDSKKFFYLVKRWRKENTN